MELRAGPVNILYENGFLRYLTIGGQEVVRMIYFAVRDRDWNTISGTILEETIEKRHHSFKITYQYLVAKAEFHLRWQVAIEGLPDGSVSFNINGIALRSFLKNRIGFCILHPIQGLAGQICLIQHPDKRLSQAEFPTYISPHQPFHNIQAMQWTSSKGGLFKLSFEGDVFETEDQRNWTDASYKTYCTPLDLPFPVEVKEGMEFRQKVTFQVMNQLPVTACNQSDKIKIEQQGESVSFPKIGIGLNAEGKVPTGEEESFLKRVEFSHIRADIHLSAPDWEIQLDSALHQEKLLGIPLQLALYIGQNPLQEIQELIEKVKKRSVSISQIVLYEEETKLTTNRSLGKVLPGLRNALPGIPIGGGTDANFAEFNRNPFYYNLTDFVTYAINPQVHAFDDLTLVENMAAQADTVKSAQHLSSGKAVHVSPVTLKPRFNAVATSSTKPSLPPADERQATYFTAHWTLGSIKYLAEAGVSGITYYETTGERGICSTDKIYPVGHLFEQLLQLQPQRVYPTLSSHSLQVSSLMVENEEGLFLLIANHTKDEQVVQLPEGLIIQELGSIGTNEYHHTLFSNSGHPVLTLPAFAIQLAKVDFLGNASSLAHNTEKKMQSAQQKER